MKVVRKTSADDNRNVLLSEIRSRLQSLADESNARFAASLIPHLQHPMTGVRLPALRDYARQLARRRQEVAPVLHELTESFEEIMLRGMFPGYADMPWSQCWEEICKFVPSIDNWSVCDSCCATYKQVRRHREEVFPQLQAYLQSQHQFQQRFAAVMMTDHFLVDDYVSRVLESWRTAEPHGYYAATAIGWGLSAAILKYPTSTLELLHDERLPLICRQKACQKILESRRTPASLRPEITALRKKLQPKK